MPPHACDAHCHVFGPGATFPYAPDRTYTPPDAPKQSLAALQSVLGIERAVIVQASCHGTDNRAMLDAIKTSDGRYRGVAILDASFTEEERAVVTRYLEGAAEAFRVVAEAPTQGVSRSDAP